MLTYFVSGSNTYTLRTKQTTNTDFTMSLQNMTTQVNSTASLDNINYSYYESLLAFTASISESITAAEYRATILSGGDEIWHGSIQVFASQSWLDIDKSDYRNQNNQYISNVSENKYVILD